MPEAVAPFVLDPVGRQQPQVELVGRKFQPDALIVLDRMGADDGSRPHPRSDGPAKTAFCRRFDPGRQHHSMASHAYRRRTLERTRPESVQLFIPAWSEGQSILVFRRRCAKGRPVRPAGRYTLTGSHAVVLVEFTDGKEIRRDVTPDASGPGRGRRRNRGNAKAFKVGTGDSNDSGAVSAAASREGIHGNARPPLAKAWSN